MPKLIHITASGREDLPWSVFIDVGYQSFTYDCTGTREEVQAGAEKTVKRLIREFDWGRRPISSKIREAIIAGTNESVGIIFEDDIIDE